MIELIAISIVVIAGIFGFFLRIEKRLSRIETNICWLKKEFLSCPPSSGKSST